MLFYILADYSYLFAQQLRSIVNPISPYPLTQAKLPAVVVLPGLYETWHILKPLTDTISLMGYDIHIIHQLQRNTKLVAELASTVDEYIHQHQLQQVTLLAHSKGCLVGKQVLLNHLEDQQVKNMIALCGPFAGSSISRLINNQFSREMATQSQTIKNLQQQKQVNDRILSIYPLHDNHIWHTEKSYLPGATNIQVNCSGHHRMVANPQVIKIIINQFANSSVSP
jgi:triacylglycerol esterase/lipase EstA (alpha/beta hydrolase family)